MLHDSEAFTGAAEPISSSLIDAIAPLVETVRREEGKEGLVLFPRLLWGRPCCWA